MTVAAVAALVDLRFRYPDATADTLVIDRFDVAGAERVFVRGPSGSGKTTLLSILAGVLIASEGSASLADRDWRTLSVAHRDRARADSVGYIFQQFNLLPYLSVVDNVVLPCEFSRTRGARAGRDRAQVRVSALDWLSRMGLSGELIERSAMHLSVGQQQRVAAARALIGGPKLVIADEPTSALDEEARESFMAVLLAACADAGSALVFVSHDARLAPAFDRQVDLAVLNRAAHVRQ